MTAFRLMFTARDYPTTVAFYRDVLEFPVVDSWDNDGGGTVLQAGGGQIEIFGGTSRWPDPPTSVGMAIQVTVDVDDLHETFTSRGAIATAEPADQPWGHRSFAVVDPNGIPITFFRELD